MEIELKLLLDPVDVNRFRRHPLLKKHALDKPQSRQLNSIYFDTPELYLKQNHTALRIRQVGRRLIQTCKSGGRVAAGLHQRPEWESEVSGAKPDLPALLGLIEAGSAVARLMSAPALAERLQPIFTTQFRRTIWLLRLPSGAEIELALDQGEVIHGDKTIPISEIELELKSGDSASLFDVALELQNSLPLRAANVSKAERGYGLHSPQTPEAVKALPLSLSPALTLEQGFQVLMHNCLAQIQGNEDGVMHGSDPEHLHQMRVGLRRLRATLSLFKKFIQAPPEIAVQLRWLAGVLGPARDWEVLAASTLNDAARRRPHEPQLEHLRQHTAGVAGKHRHAAANALASRAYARLLLSLGSWLEGRRWRQQQGAEQIAALSMPLKKFARSKLLKLQKKLLERAKGIKLQGPAKRHRLRIAAKKVRYAAEFFESYFPFKRMRPYVQALSELQDLLGVSNDRNVAGSLLQQIAEQRPELEPHCDLALSLLDEGARLRTSKIRRIWRKFAELAPPARPA
ncbi:CYTH and CHAD domain-containing protein [Collimonas humicola]|uniref:CYTH and CHAD domain-containing protein n=1 Tax=Collimonas humicola TaxID=2825886 RepID=UPI001B8C58B4|nr:CYTH and CHAD domain-containing protein [Collimonas humicola]